MTAPQPERRQRPSRDQFEFRPPRPEEWDDWPCWISSRVDGLNIRRRPSRDSASVGRLDSGDYLPAKCYSVDGDEYRSCGGSHWWIPVYYRGRTCYVAWACVDWYSNGDDGGPGVGISEGPQPDRR